MRPFSFPRWLFWQDILTFLVVDAWQPDQPSWNSESFAPVFCTACPSPDEVFIMLAGLEMPVKWLQLVHTLRKNSSLKLGLWAENLFYYRPLFLNNPSLNQVSKSKHFLCLHKNERQGKAIWNYFSPPFHNPLQGVCGILFFNKYTYFWQFAYLFLLSMWKYTYFQPKWLKRQKLGNF